MTSERKIAANRKNARKSTGPQTGEGKARASRNAMRHGLDAAKLVQPGVCNQADRIAKMICGDRPGALLYDQAVIIAESQILLTRVRTARVAAVERMRKGTFKVPPPLPGFPTRDELDGLVDQLRQGNLGHVVKVVKRMTSSLKAGVRMQALADARGKSEQPIQDAYTAALRAAYDEANEERDDLACVSRALPEILSLERYERRALSRRRRAIRRFTALLA